MGLSTSGSVLVVSPTALLRRCGRQRPAYDRTPRLSHIVTTPPSTGSGVAAPGEVPDGLEEYYAQDLQWQGCEQDQGGFECATVSAPLDYADPGGDSIELALVRPAGAGEDAPHLLVNPGGPGVSGVDMVVEGLDYAISADVQDHYTVVGFDPRGVSRSAPVTCLTDEEMDEAREGHIDPSTEEGLEQLREATGKPRAGKVRLIAVGFLFTLARFSEAFLILKGIDIGLSEAMSPITLAVFNLAYVVLAYPAGALSDRMSPRAILGVGMAALIAGNLVLASASSFAIVMVGTALWGAHMALTQGIFARMIADSAPEGLRATSFGAFWFVSGVAGLLASLGAGWLWEAAGPPFAFSLGALHRLPAVPDAGGGGRHARPPQRAAPHQGARRPSRRGRSDHRPRRALPPPAPRGLVAVPLQAVGGERQVTGLAAAGVVQEARTGLRRHGVRRDGGG